MFHVHKITCVFVGTVASSQWSRFIVSVPFFRRKHASMPRSFSPATTAWFHVSSHARARWRTTAVFLWFVSTFAKEKKGSDSDVLRVDIVYTYI